LQSDVARDLLRGAPADLPDSIVLVEGKAVWVRSTAALRVARGIGLPWSLAYAFILVPRPLRDAVYDWIARHRYRWFGRRDTCRVPTPEERARFLG
jgi:predicted DCC family thiol-disulfide oxidoreductase YuxK